ncbi:MAG: hypothetical protein HGJ94_12590 [Desulfosarcina sp.]|nr:hypothetical protein [Desulfosarcina sp.]MBC2744982.1 hypothetical protein [Desulfosarcina sp.]MBC2767890.1 hypothetical protein [Desulfosarcina sp.]
MGNEKPAKDRRTADPYMDRRSGEDRREAYDIDYFTGGGTERRKRVDRRKREERRKDCTQISKWSSVCVDEIKNK